MKKLVKAMRIILLAVVILVVALVVVINLFANHALKIGIEAAATKTLNVGVSIAEVDLSIMGGRIGFRNLRFKPHSSMY